MPGQGAFQAAVPAKGAIAFRLLPLIRRRCAMAQIFDDRWRERGSLWLLGLSLVMVFSACSNHGPGVIGPQGGKLAPCPDRPNCVCSDAADPRRRVAPFALQGPAAEAWQALEAHLTTLRRVQLVTVSPFYLHAVFRSRVFGFSDDVEFYLRPQAGEIAVRSASRTGYFDFGVNRRRIEAIRSHLTGLGVLKGS
jgi:uncharacterized protein (DUF1499 family)